MTDILFELQQKVAMKPALEAKLRELQNQRREYDREVISLRVAFRKEQEDVEKLEGRSLANYFFQVVGKLDEKLDQERREAYAAKVKLDAAERELAGIESDIAEIQTQLNEIRVAEAQYKEELEKKRAMLKVSGTAAADQILEIEQKIAALEAQKREIKEAISAGYSARGTADRILSELESADGWNTWDMFGGGVSSPIWPNTAIWMRLRTLFLISRVSSDASKLSWQTSRSQPICKSISTASCGLRTTSLMACSLTGPLEIRYASP